MHFLARRAPYRANGGAWHAKDGAAPGLVAAPSRLLTP
ncbi:MAG: hypothetical protein JWP48_1765 [Actinoallomurus sp.]|jgi:hypothetical protein|nr:hypothetical protein [Actinoallomurus sp.]